MTIRWMRWSVAVATLAVGAGTYFGVPGVRSAIDDTVMRLVTGSTGDTRTYWCPMDPEIVRKGPGMCPV